MTPEHELPLDHSYASPYFAHTNSLASVVSLPDIDWPRAGQHPYFYIGIYAAISLSVAFVNVAGAITQYSGALRASRKLFKQLLACVVRATMRWHDVTPQGESLRYDNTAPADNCV